MEEEEEQDPLYWHSYKHTRVQNILPSHVHTRHQSIWITFTAAVTRVEQSWLLGSCRVYIVSIGENIKQPNTKTHIQTQSETILEIRAVAGSVGTCDVNVIPLTYTLDLLLFLSHFNTPPQAHCWVQG